MHWILTAAGLLCLQTHPEICIRHIASTPLTDGSIAHFQLEAPGYRSDLEESLRLAQLNGERWAEEIDAFTPPAPK